MHSYAQLFMWAVGIQTQALTLVQQAFLPTEPSSQPCGQFFLKINWMVGPLLAHDLLNSEQRSFVNAVTSPDNVAEPTPFLYSYLLQLH